jgi:carbon-monoxide dehydrogenase medium subunit
VIPAERFFVIYLTTDLAADELLSQARFPLNGQAVGWGFQELSRRFDDYAIAAAATMLVLAPDGTIAKARIALAGVADRAIRAREAEALLVGTRGDEPLRRGARIAAAALTPPADVHGVRLSPPSGRRSRGARSGRRLESGAASPWRIRAT